MAIGRTNDEGIDGVIKEDKLGLDMIYVQAKRWGMGTSIGRPEIQKFVGALAGQGAKKGLFITTANFAEKEFLAVDPVYIYVFFTKMDTSLNFKEQSC
jgi:restriction system protein